MDSRGLHIEERIKALAKEEIKDVTYIERFREYFSDAEAKYFLATLSIKALRDDFIKYLDLSDEELLTKAMEIKNKIEMGLLETEEDLWYMNNLPIEKGDAIHLNNLSNAEALMTLLIFASYNREDMLELVHDIETMVNNEKEGNISI